jgi:phage baseplate assembly protein gpV
MMELFNKMKGAATAAMQQVGQNRWGIVSNVRQTDTGYLARITLQPDGVQSGWLPVLSQMVGAGWGLVCPPEVGMQAFVGSDSGDGHHGVILGLSYSLAAMPPVPPANFDQPNGTPVGPGEIALVSKFGAVIRLCADGSIHMQGNVRIDGTLTVQDGITANTGNITASTGDVLDKHNSLDTVRSTYNIHHHGNGPTPTPTVPE